MFSSARKAIELGLFDFFKKQLIDVIEWTEDKNGILAFRYPMADREIQNGAQLTVRDSQLALFVNEGQMGDLFEPGRHTLVTKNLPVLTSLRNWDTGFKSPFKSDIFFFSTRDQIDQRWGTSQPLVLRDTESGTMSIRAHGTYAYKIRNPKIFFTKISGTKDSFTTQEMEGQLRSLVLTKLGPSLESLNVSFAEMSAQQNVLSEKLKVALQSSFEEYGLTLQSFLVQSISQPDSQDPMESLKKLHELLSTGIITQAEFDAKKTQLLGKIK